MPRSPTRIAVSYARHHDSAVAVAECVAGLGGQARPQLLLVFCGGKHDPEIVLAALRSAYGPVAIVGGAAAGVIAHGGFGYTGIELGVLAFYDPAFVPRCCTTLALSEGEQAAGQALGAAIGAVAAEDATVLLLYDSVFAGFPLRLHPASSLIAGVQAGLAGRRANVFGAGLLTDLNLSDAWLFDGRELRRHAAVALVFPPALGIETVVLHGCSPISAFMEITRVDGAEVFELDGEPALPVIERMLGLPPRSADSATLSLTATLGQKQGDLFAPYDENAYVNRLIVSADRERGSVTLFEPDFAEGARVQIMSRDNALMLDSVRRGVEAANRLAQRPGTLCSLYIDCAGRASAKTGAPVEEAQLVVDNLVRTSPLLGFYSGVEIAPFGGYSRPLDWTGVLAVLRERT